MMAKHCDISVLNKVNYEWHIKDLDDYLDILEEHELFTISSKKFPIYNSEDLKFFFKITFSSRSIKCYLCRSVFTEYNKLIGQVFLMDDRKTRYDEKKFEIGHSIHVEGNRQYLVKLEYNSSDLLSNIWKSRKTYIKKSPYEKISYDLTVGCKFTVLEDYMKIERIYTPKPSQSINDHFKKLLKCKDGTDVVIEVDGKKFQAHKSILLARSPVFAAMFTHDMVENNTNQVKIEDISASTFESLLHFIYTDEIETSLNIETGTDLLEAASKYQLDGLQNLCETQLFKLITMENAESMRSLAIGHHLSDFEKIINAFIQFHQT